MAWCLVKYDNFTSLHFTLLYFTFFYLTLPKDFGLVMVMVMVMVMVSSICERNLHQIKSSSSFQSCYFLMFSNRFSIISGFVLLKKGNDITYCCILPENLALVLSRPFLFISIDSLVKIIYA